VDVEIHQKEQILIHFPQVAVIMTKEVEEHTTGASYGAREPKNLVSHHSLVGLRATAADKSQELCQPDGILI
jgi:hypothetical protein